MERIVALVEGHTEEHFVRSTYANVIVQRPFPNGKSVSLEFIVDAIVNSLEFVGGNIRRVLILLDREERLLSASDMAAYITNSVSARCPGRLFYVGVSDRHIENWVLADEQQIRMTYGDPQYIYAGDGTNGKPLLKRLLGPISLGPRDRAQLIRDSSALRGAQKSESLKNFVSRVDFDWYWAKR